VQFTKYKAHGVCGQGRRIQEVGRLAIGQLDQADGTADERECLFLVVLFALGLSVGLYVQGDVGHRPQPGNYLVYTVVNDHKTGVG
jgi:hypothetical protein